MICWFVFSSFQLVIFVVCKCYRVFPKIRQGLLLIFFRKITLGLIFGGRLLFSFIINKITKQRITRFSNIQNMKIEPFPLPHVLNYLWEHYHYSANLFIKQAIFFILNSHHKKLFKPSKNTLEDKKKFPAID